ncbi:MAG: hypothetical protein ACRC1K_12335 [Planctomycetia bacterium]
MRKFRLTRGDWVIVGLLLLGLAAWEPIRKSVRSGARLENSAQVEGTVSLDDRPLAFGTVLFTPIDPADESRTPAVGRIEADGSYRLGNANAAGRTGLAPGRYKVAVVAVAVGPPSDGPRRFRGATPAVYADERTTPLEAEVLAGGNRYDCRLTSGKSSAAAN